MIIQFDKVRQVLGDNQFYYDFKVESSITGVFGPSGSGKTTMLNLLAGLDFPNKGKIKLNNETLVDTGKKILISGKNRNIGYIFQDNYLFPHLSVKRNLLYSKPYTKNKTRYISFNDIINVLDIKNILNKKPRQLSGGERQRVAIGRALLSQPQLLLLDEPFSNVDCSKRKQIISYLLSINKSFNIPMLIVSHHLEDILKLTKNVVLVEDGISTAYGDILTIIRNGEKPEFVKAIKYQNTFESVLSSYSIDDDSFITMFEETKINISNNSRFLNHNTPTGTRVQLSLRPTDIALSLDINEGTSIQNQLKGTVKDIIENEDGVYCIINCGFNLFVKISKPIISKLYLHKGQNIYCQIRANDFDVVHIFEKPVHQELEKNKVKVLEEIKG